MFSHRMAEKIVCGIAVNGKGIYYFSIKILWSNQEMTYKNIIK